MAGRPVNAFTGDGFGKPHGTTTKYGSGCRCDECKAAQSAYAKKRREQKQAWPVSIPEHVHGTKNGYTGHSCRCDPCRDAHRQYKNELNARTREMRDWRTA